MWNASFREADCPIDRVLDGLDIRREAPTRLHLFKWMLDARFRHKEGEDNEGLSPPHSSTSSGKAAIFSPFRWTCCRSTEAAVQQEDHYHPNNA